MTPTFNKLKTVHVTDIPTHLFQGHLNLPKWFIEDYKIVSYKKIKHDTETIYHFNNEEYGICFRKDPRQVFLVKLITQCEILKHPIDILMSLSFQKRIDSIEYGEFSKYINGSNWVKNGGDSDIIYSIYEIDKRFIKIETDEDDEVMNIYEVVPYTEFRSK